MTSQKCAHAQGNIGLIFDRVPDQCTLNMYTIPESVDRGLSTGTTHVNVRDAQPRDPDFLRSVNVRIAGLRITYINMGGTSRKPSVHRFWNVIYVGGALVGNAVKKSNQYSLVHVHIFCDVIPWVRKQKNWQARCVYFFAISGPIEQVLASILMGSIMVFNVEMHVL